jgi:hypothetical protein
LGPPDLDLTAADDYERPAGSKRRRTAAHGGGLAGAPWNRAGGLGFMRKRHQDVARATARLTRAAWTAWV